MFVSFVGTHVSAASNDADVDTRVAAPFPTLTGIGIAGRFTLVSAEHSSEQRTLFHPVRGEPWSVRVWTRAQGHLQQVRKQFEILIYRLQNITEILYHCDASDALFVQWASYRNALKCFPIRGSLDIVFFFFPGDENEERWNWRKKKMIPAPC